MTRRWRLASYLGAIAVISVSFFLIFIGQTSAAINEQIPFYGTLVNASGTPLTGTYDMVFRFYDAPTGGTLLDTSTHTAGNGNAVQVTDGEFSVLLGSGAGNALDGLDFNTTNIYVGFTVEGDSEMTPRERLAAAPYAFNADTLDGNDSSDFVGRSGTSSVTASAADTLFTITQNGAGDIFNVFDGGSEVFSVIDGGNVGIGTTSPSRTLSVAGDAIITGALYDNSNSTGNNGFVLQSTGSGFSWVATSTLGLGGGGASALSDLSDADVAGHASGSILVSNGTTFFDRATSTLGIALSDTTGTLAASRGGTGLSTITDNQLLIGSAGNAWTQIATSSLNIDAVLLSGLSASQFLRADQANASGTVTNLTFVNATGTTFSIAGDSFNDLTGTGLTASAGALAVTLGTSIDEAELNITGSPTNGYVLQASSTSAGGFVWVATSTLGFSGDPSLFTDAGSFTYLSSTSDEFSIGTSTRGDAKLTVQTDGAGDIMNLFDSGGFAALTVLGSGRVGIATTTPGQELTIDADMQLAGAFFDGTNSAGVNGYVLQSTGGSVQWVATSSLGISGSSLFTDSGSLSYLTDTSDRFAIGTTTSIGSSLVSFSSSTASALLSLSQYGTGDIVNIFDGPTEVFTIQDGGNVGIGTSTPAVELVVSGDFQLTGGLYDNANTRGTNGQVLQTTGAGIQWVSTSTLGFDGDGTTATYVVGTFNSPDTSAADYIATTTNAEVQIQQAVNALPTGGGVVYLLPGTYNIGNQINLGNSVVLEGSGSSTVLRLEDDTTNDIAIIAVNNASGVVVRDLHLEGNQLNNNLNDNQNGLTLNNVSSSTITNVLARDFQDHGIQLDNSSNVRVTNSSFADNENHGIYLNTNNKGNIIAGNVSSNNGWRGVAVWTGSSNNLITHNVFNYNDVGIWEFTASNNSYLGNTLRENDSNGVRIDSGSNSLIADNVVEFSELRGLYITDSTNVSVRNNSFVSNGGGLNSTVLIDLTSDDVSFTNNNLIATGTQPFIDIAASTVVGTYIAGNIYDNPDTSDNVNDLGTNTIFDDGDRRTLLTNTLRNFSLMSIFGSTSVPLASSTQLGTGDILSLNTTSGNALTVANDGSVGIGTSTPNRARLTVQSGGVGNLFSLFDGTTEVFTVFDGGNVNVGTTSTSSKAKLTIATTSSSVVASISQYGTGDILNLFDGGNEVMTVIDGGGVGIGTSSPASLLDVWGSVRAGTSSVPTLFADTLAHTVRIATTTDLSASTTLTVDGTIGASNLLGGGTTLSTDANGNIIRTPSDARLKTNISSIDDALPKVLELRGVSFEWVDTERFGDVTELGFIAQEVELILPEVVRGGGDYLSLNIPNMLAVVVEAIKEMWQVVSGNRDDIDQLKEENKTLKNRLANIESELQIEAAEAEGPAAEPSGGIEDTSDTSEVTDEASNDSAQVDVDPEPTTATSTSTSTPPVASTTPSASSTDEGDSTASDPVLEVTPHGSTTELIELELESDQSINEEAVGAEPITTEESGPDSTSESQITEESVSEVSVEKASSTP